MPLGGGSAKCEFWESWHGAPPPDRARAEGEREIAMPGVTTSDVDFILAAAPRLAKLSAMVTVSFGLAEGANRALKHAAQKTKRSGSETTTGSKQS
jgi:hypothetical protein